MKKNKKRLNKRAKASSSLTVPRERAASTSSLKNHKHQFSKCSSTSAKRMMKFHSGQSLKTLNSAANWWSPRNPSAAKPISKPAKTSPSRRNPTASYPRRTSPKRRKERTASLRNFRSFWRKSKATTSTTSAWKKTTKNSWRSTAKFTKRSSRNYRRRWRNSQREWWCWIPTTTVWSLSRWTSRRRSAKLSGFSVDIAIFRGKTRRKSGKTLMERSHRRA